MSDRENITVSCPSVDISAYIDGELSLERELEMEVHFSSCSGCSLELNQQKQFLCGLDSSLKRENDLELPPDFARSIVANAESTVSGLRRPNERFNAAFICAALLLFVLFVLGSEAAGALGPITNFFDQVFAVGGFFAHLVYSIFVGISVVIRAAAAQFSPDLMAGSASILLFAAILLFISRRVWRIRRV